MATESHEFAFTIGQAVKVNASQRIVIVRKSVYTGVASNDDFCCEQATGGGLALYAQTELSAI